MNHADQDRRDALHAVVAMGAGDAPAESFRVVAYLMGSLDHSADTIARFGRYAHGRCWRVIQVFNDIDPDKPAWIRRGLLSAVATVCHGEADGIVIEEPVFNELTPSDQSWLNQRLQRFGGFLHVIAGEDPPSECGRDASG